MVRMTNLLLVLGFWGIIDICKFYFVIVFSAEK